jgi:hypothetical protein
MNFIGMDIDNKEDANIIKKKQNIEEILKNEENGKLVIIIFIIIL